MRDNAEERLREGKIYFLGAELIQKTTSLSWGMLSYGTP